MTSPIIEGLKKELEGLAKEVKPEKIGRVIEVSDGIARLSGLSGVASQEMLSFETMQGMVEGIAFNLEEDTVGAIILGDDKGIKEGDEVRSTGRIIQVPVGQGLLGRVKRL